MVKPSWCLHFAFESFLVSLGSLWIKGHCCVEKAGIVVFGRTVDLSHALSVWNVVYMGTRLSFSLVVFAQPTFAISTAVRHKKRVACL